eukprot:356174-Chlamydomonas_euryale.AAC.16
MNDGRWNAKGSRAGTAGRLPFPLLLRCHLGVMTAAAVPRRLGRTGAGALPFARRCQRGARRAHALQPPTDVLSQTDVEAVQLSGGTSKLNRV